jgi:hypothetical protein
VSDGAAIGVPGRTCVLVLGWADGRVWTGRTGAALIRSGRRGVRWGGGRQGGALGGAERGAASW